MPEFVTVAKADEIAPGYIKLVEVRGHKIALCNADGTFYAIDDTCTHQENSLSDGEIEGESIVCISHGSMFNLRTGIVERGPAEQATKTHHVHIVGDEIKIAIPETQ